MKLMAIALAVIALMVVGFLFLKLPPPVIVVAPETVFHLGPLDITNTMFTSWWVVVLMAIIAVVVGRKACVIPSGFYGYVEAAVMAFYDIVEQVAGPENGRRFFPLVGTIFFFVLFSNYFGLLPMNNVIGLPEPAHGESQAVFEQTTIAGVDLAYMPLQVETVDIGAGEVPLLPEGVELEHAEESHDEAGEGEGAGEGEEGTTTGEGHGATLTTSHDLVSAVPGQTHDAAAPAVEEVEHTTDGRFSGILAPYFRSVMTDITAPLAIAIFSFIFVEFWGLQSLGAGYLTKFFAFGAFLRKNPLMALIDVFVGLLEFVSELSRMVSFTFRLFGNIFAGEVLLLMMSFLVPFLLVDVFYGLELFVGLIQAFVFAMLTTVFAVTAVTLHGDHDE